MPFRNPHPLYSVWRSMINRCRCMTFKQWQDYGGRGITICDRWLVPKVGFHNFVADMGDRPPGHSLDRIDNSKGYSPENCRWATKKEQQRNQRVTRKVVIEGKEYIAADLADISGQKTDVIVDRARRGLSYAEVVDPNKRVYMEGLKIGHKYGRGASKYKTR